MSQAMTNNRVLVRNHFNTFHQTQLRRKKPLNAKEAPSLGGDHRRPFGWLPHSSFLPQFGGGRQGDTFGCLLVSAFHHLQP